MYEGKIKQLYLRMAWLCFSNKLSLRVFFISLVLWPLVLGYEFVWYSMLLIEGWAGVNWAHTQVGQRLNQQNLYVQKNVHGLQKQLGRWVEYKQNQNAIKKNWNSIQTTYKFVLLCLKKLLYAQCWKSPTNWNRSHVYLSVTRPFL